jgi:hypothetical protein
VYFTTIKTEKKMWEGEGDEMKQDRQMVMSEDL